MKSFGVWLHESHLTLSEVVALRAVATTLAQNWPIASNQRGYYETSISIHLPAAAQPDALQQLGALWPVYELDNREVDQNHTGNGIFASIINILNKGPEQRSNCSRYNNNIHILFII